MSNQSTTKKLNPVIRAVSYIEQSVWRTVLFGFGLFWLASTTTFGFSVYAILVIVAQLVLATVIIQACCRCTKWMRKLLPMIPLAVWALLLSVGFFLVGWNWIAL